MGVFGSFMISVITSAPAGGASAQAPAVQRCPTRQYPVGLPG
jgi:hypothetical protein